MKNKTTLITAALLGGLAFSGAALADDQAALTDTNAYIVLAQAEAVEDYNSLFAEQMMSNHDELMPMLDKDGDGMCSRDEFMQAHDRIFRAVDANNDGMLSEAEMARVEESLGKTAVN
ncbi:hypothetical protein SADO_02290 [Salinisphaera dokdonensis CL-ES53]|uniref:EF-hand domain-containing protein n=1 Tax=Salinisphaera dokdonensis CL-ES53 TaxID=1304272 RepID=A0ABV2AXQ3_9GAMM